MRWDIVVVVAACLALGSLILVVGYRRRRAVAYARMARQRRDLVRGHSPQVAVTDPASARAEFQQRRLARIPDFLAAECLRRLRGEAESSIPRRVASYIPTHKTGRTLSYEDIYRHAPGCLAFYHDLLLRPTQPLVAGA